MNQILIFDITQKNKQFGKMYYDKENDDILFVNKMNEAISLTCTKLNNRSTIFRDNWISGISYQTNDIVVSDNCTYICIKNNTDANVKNNAYWQKLSGQSQSILFAFFTSESCCYKYDENAGISVFTKCKHQTPEESEMYGSKQLEVTEDIDYILPFTFITKNDTDCFEFKDDCIHIKKSGYYKVTYNIVYRGSVRTVISKMIVTNSYQEDTDGDYNVFSTNKSVNRMHNDDRNDEYYLNEDNMDETTQYINHTFFIPIPNDKHVSHKLEMALLFKNSIGKVILLHPIETWINIERIGDH